MSGALRGLKHLLPPHVVRKLTSPPPLRSHSPPTARTHNTGVPDPTTPGTTQMDQVRVNADTSRQLKDLEMGLQAEEVRRVEAEGRMSGALQVAIDQSERGREALQRLLDNAATDVHDEVSGAEHRCKVREFFALDQL